MVELTAVVAVTIDVVAESATRVDENADGASFLQRAATVDITSKWIYSRYDDFQKVSRQKK